MIEAQTTDIIILLAKARAMATRIVPMTILKECLCSCLSTGGLCHSNHADPVVVLQRPKGLLIALILLYLGGQIQPLWNSVNGLSSHFQSSNGKDAIAKGLPQQRFRSSVLYTKIDQECHGVVRLVPKSDTLADLGPI